MTQVAIKLNVTAANFPGCYTASRYDAQYYDTPYWQAHHRSIWIFGPMNPATNPTDTWTHESRQAQHIELRQRILAKYRKQHPGFSQQPLPFRILAEVRRRWKILITTGLVALILLPAWPILFLIFLFRRGRDTLWSLLVKIDPLAELLFDVRKSFLDWKLSFSGENVPAQPLIHQPQNTSITGKSNTYSSSAQLLQQLSPQSRLLLRRLLPGKVDPLSATELPELLSLHRSERSIIRIVGAGDTGAGQ